jgi:AmiR/NasT family two-component response regulator
MNGSVERDGQESSAAGTAAAAARAVAAALEQLITQLDSYMDILQVSHAASTGGQEALLEENRQLREALGSRATIERAKGVLMARHGYSEQDAFKLLADTARQQHRKVRRVAEDLLLGLSADVATRAAASLESTRTVAVGSGNPRLRVIA